MTPTGQKFYRLHNADAKGSFYAHAMIFSPCVQLIKDDAGNWVEPLEVDFVTSPAVNTGAVWKKFNLRIQRRNEKEGGDASVTGKEELSKSRPETQGGPTVTEEGIANTAPKPAVGVED